MPVSEVGLAWLTVTSRQIKETEILPPATTLRADSRYLPEVSVLCPVCKMDENTSASLSKLLTNSSSWNLSNDDALLDVMRGVSENFLSRTNQILDKMDKLSLDAASVLVKLETANNSFMLLSNIKFIEARVYDDNEEEEKKENSKATEETESEDVRISEALRCGTDLVSSGFEKVAINDSETESEDESEREVYVLQPKNSYHLRSLPHIIGTTEWFSDPKIGLGDEEQEDENAGDQDTESESEDEIREDDRKSDLSDFSDSENDEKPPTSPSGPKHDADNEFSEGDSVSEFSDDDDDLFKPKVQNDPPKAPKITDDRIDSEVDNAEEEDDEDAASITVTKKTSFADELANKLGGNVASGTNKQSLNVKEDQKPAVSALQKSTLFDSSDSDDDLFSAKPSLPPPPPKQANKPKPKLEAREQSSAAQNIQPVQPPKNSVDEGNKKLPPAETEARKEIKTEPVFSQKNIFSESSDEDDIFADLKVGVGENKNDDKNKSFLDRSEDSDSDDIFASLGADVRQRKALEDIKDDKKEETDRSDVDELFSTSINEKPGTKEEFEDSKQPEEEITEKNPSKKKAPVGGVSLFAGFNPASIFKKKQVSSDDEPDEVDNQQTIPASDAATPANETRNEGTIDKTIPDSSQSVSEINDSDLMIENKTEVLTTLTKSRPRVGGQRRPPSRAARKKEAENSIFTDTTDGVDEDATEKDVSSQQIQNDVKEEEEKEEKPAFKPPIGGISLFGNMNPKDVLKKKQKVEEVIADSSSEDEKTGNSLFENLLPKKKTVDSNTSAINSKIDDFLEEDDDDLFGPKPLVNDEAEDEVPSFEPPPMNSTKMKTSLDIFDADSDDEDLFSDLLVKKTETKAPEVNNLFGDDDDDDEFDDLFSSLIKK